MSDEERQSLIETWMHAQGLDWVERDGRSRAEWKVFLKERGWRCRESDHPTVADTWLSPEPFDETLYPLGSAIDIVLGKMKPPFHR